MPAVAAESIAPRVETQALVGRQPIFDRERRLVAYELLYRSADPGQVEATAATAQVLVNTFLEIGLDAIVGPHRAFLNFDTQLLCDDTTLALPPDRVTIEILESVSIDARLIAAVERLVARGYQIALDDFVYQPCWEPLIRLASFVKLDVLVLPPDQLARHIEFLRGRGLRLLAEKVETQEQYAQLHAMGFDLFQGFFFAKPQIMRGRKPPSNRLNLMRVLSALQDPDVQTYDLEPLLSADAGLSFRLLRYLRSPAFGLSRPIESLRTAIAYFGLVPLKRWVSLIALSDLDDASPELLKLGLVRARLCELLAESHGVDVMQQSFTVGLLSVLDALLGRSMADIVAELPLPDPITQALLARSGLLGAILNCTIACERCNWDTAAIEGHDLSSIHRLYRAAMSWADTTLAQL